MQDRAREKQASILTTVVGVEMGREVGVKERVVRREVQETCQAEIRL